MANVQATTLSTQDSTERATALAEAISAVPGVSRLSPGRFGEVATYLPGGRVPGIRLGAESLDVHVVADWGVSVPELAAQVRSAASDVIGAGRIDVYVDDMQSPDSEASSRPR
jgi:hypothetical protein